MSWEMDISKVAARSARVCKRGSWRPFSILLMKVRPMPECTARSIWLHERLSLRRRRRWPNLKAMLIFGAGAGLGCAMVLCAEPTGLEILLLADWRRAMRVRVLVPSSEGEMRFLPAVLPGFCTPPASAFGHHGCVALLLHKLFLTTLTTKGTKEHEGCTAPFEQWPVRKIRTFLFLRLEPVAICRGRQ